MSKNNDIDMLILNITPRAAPVTFLEEGLFVKCRVTAEQVDITILRERLEDIDYPNKFYWMRKLDQCYFGGISFKLKRRIITMLTKRLIKD